MYVYFILVMMIVGLIGSPSTIRSSYGQNESSSNTLSTNNASSNTNNNTTMSSSSPSSSPVNSQNLAAEMKRIGSSDNNPVDIATLAYIWGYPLISMNRLAC